MENNQIEKVMRMITHNGILYFRQEDLCDLVETMKKKSGSINAKSQFKELLDILMCNTNTEDRE